MFSLRRHRQWGALGVACVVLWAAMWSTVARCAAPAAAGRALAAADAITLAMMEGCASHGAQAPQTGPDDSPWSTASADHCPLCTLHGPHPGLPPAALALTLAGAVLADAPTLFWQAPRLLNIWASAQSRGPPELGQA